LLSATRLLVISDYNTTTATTVASSGGYINTLLGSIIPLVPVFIPYVALLLLLFQRFILSAIAFVSAAFIAPTPLTLPVTLPLARADEHYIAALVTGNKLITVLLAVVLVGAAWTYHRSFFEALGTLGAVIVALALLSTVSIRDLSLPQRLRLAATGDLRVIAAVLGDLPRAALLGLLIIPLVLNYYNSFPGSGALVSTVAVVTTLALLPYIWYIYPIPHHSGYYAAVLHEPWLPAEKVTLSTGRVYYGYVLSSDTAWFTLLLANSRTIRYVPADDVIGQKLCQPKLQDQPAQNPPLIALLYTPPAHISQCPDRDIATTRISILSHGQSLRAISLAVHIPPKKIISTTNDYQHQKLSAALRTYENLHNWNAPTPVGQHFWYYPRVRP
jgi:hypothetical protein